MQNPSPITTRQDYRLNPDLNDRVFQLTTAVFPGLDKAWANAALLGSRWVDGSTPFVVQKDGEVISHAGLIDMLWVVEGKEQVIGGVHGVATRADARRQGHFRRIMGDLLDYCDGRYTTLELTTGNPEYYEPFGFRSVEEFRFIARINAPGRDGGLRPLDSATEADRRLLLEALDRRTPVSHTLGLKTDWHSFTFAWGMDAVYACDALDCLLVMKAEGNRLHLYDIIGSTLPSVSALAEVLPWPVSEIAFYFTPDRFDVDARPQPHRYNGDVFMVRGPFVAENTPIMAPVTSRH